jgi:Asp-tRNA(Asn)/Glu-tRNA(Gln) amidotransferase A subunit family amidase
LSRFAFVSAEELRRLYATGEISPVEVATDLLDHLGTVEPSLNAFALVTADLALAQARTAERRLRQGDHSWLLGLPLSVKDLLPMAGLPCRYGSRLRSDTIADTDAAVVAAVKTQGAVILGKTTTSEFGAKAAGNSPLTGITRNPWDLSASSGGSSAGAAASVAAGVTPFAIGTDGGGSIRIPAALCGLFGLKPQFGRIPFRPEAAAPSLAHIGIISRSVADAALLLEAVSGKLDRPSRSGPLRIAWSPTLGYATPQPEIIAIDESLLARLAGEGHRIEEVASVFPFDPAAAWWAEFYGNLAARLPPESEPRLDPALARALTRARQISADAMRDARTERGQVMACSNELFRRFDLLATPTLPVTKLAAGSDVPPELPDREMLTWPSYTYPFNLTGQPAASIPSGITRSGHPVGLQLVAPPHGEALLLGLAAEIERLAVQTIGPVGFRSPIFSRDPAVAAPSCKTVSPPP